MLWTLWLIVQMVLIIAALLAVMGACFYGVAWVTLAVVQFFPMVGKRHRHTNWVEMNKRSGRK